MLYGLAQARDAAWRAKELVVVEGYMDAIALSQAGFAHTVASLGTAFGENQLRALWRIVDEPVLCFDGDEAGQRAARRAAERALPLLAPGKSLRFACLPDERDPDDMVRQDGAAALRAVVERARTPVDLLWSSEVEAVASRFARPPRPLQPQPAGAGFGHTGRYGAALLRSRGPLPPPGPVRRQSAAGAGRPPSRAALLGRRTGTG